MLSVLAGAAHAKASLHPLVVAKFPLATPLLYSHDRFLQSGQSCQFARVPVCERGHTILVLGGRPAGERSSGDFFGCPGAVLAPCCAILPFTLIVRLQYAHIALITGRSMLCYSCCALSGFYQSRSSAITLPSQRCVAPLSLIREAEGRETLLFNELHSKGETRRKKARFGLLRIEMEIFYNVLSQAYPRKKLVVAVVAAACFFSSIFPLVNGAS